MSRLFFIVLAASAAVATLASAADLPLTPAQTEGPYYPATRPADTDADLTRIGNGPVAKGRPLALTGTILDPASRPIQGARIEIWQTDAQGIYMHPGDRRTAGRDKAFQFYGETRSGPDGAFRFLTLTPAPYTGRPRHIHAKVTPLGGQTLTTQFYFAGDPDLASDPIARRLGKALERITLTPRPGADGTDTAEVTIVVRR